MFHSSAVRGLREPPNSRTLEHSNRRTAELPNAFDEKEVA